MTTSSFRASRSPRPRLRPRRSLAAPKPEPAPAPEPGPPSAGGGAPQGQTNSGQKIRRQRDKPKELSTEPEAEPEDEGHRKRRNKNGDDDGGAGLRNSDGTPTPGNPGFVDALPGPSTAAGVPNFIIRKFRVPPFLLPIYQAAGIEYGIRWEVLAAINEIETDYGRNLNVSSAGALGWMQFMPATWKAYGTDANKDGRKDPYNPVDAIFAAARYLKAANYENDVRAAIWAYNHADWYVDSVLLRARLIAGVPADLIGSLTGLTEGRFPVYARARYADDLAEQQVLKRVEQGENAANVIESADERRSVDIYADPGAPVVAVNDGEIKAIGKSRELGRYVVLQDVYGNRYTYSRLGVVSRNYPVPKQDAVDTSTAARAVKANGTPDADLPKPSAPASAGRQLDASDSEPAAKRPAPDSEDSPEASVPVKQRLFAHPDMEGARDAGGLEQILDRKARKNGTYEVYKNYFSRPYGLDPDKVTLRRLKVGSRVIGGTIVGRIGRTVAGQAPHVDFAIRPAGKGAPRIDPKPILDGWKLLEATAIYRASGKNVLHGDDVEGMSIGQILLLPKPQLERRVLADERIEVYECGRDDIRSGQVDRRVLATLAYLAESGMRPSVTSLKCGHGYFTSLGQRLPPLLGQRGRHLQGQRHPDPGPPGGGGHHRADGAAAHAASGHDGARADHLALRDRRFDLRHGRPPRPHSRRVPAHVRRQPQARQGRTGGAEARSVVRPARSARRDREPRRANQALQVRAARGQARQRSPRGRVAPRTTKRSSASSSSSSASCWGPRTAVTSCVPSPRDRRGPSWS